MTFILSINNVLLLFILMLSVSSSGNPNEEAKPLQMTAGTTHGNIYIVPSGTAVIWDFPVSGTWDEVVIEDGATLKVKSQLYLVEDTYINVRRGGKLVVDGGRISGTCGMWGGINVWGTKDSPPDTPGAHGKVELKNGAIIENALIGINTTRVDVPGEGIDPDYTGGQIYASSSTIRNCQTGVYIQPYPYDSWCTFVNCTFETTGELAEPGLLPEAHMKLSGVQNIRIKGATFRNTRDLSACNIDERGTGIYGFDSQFEVSAHCLSGDIPCSQIKESTFGDMFYGVKALTPRPTKTFTITGSEFTENFRGLYVSGVSNISVTGNSFQAIENTMGMEDDYCMYMDHCTGYEVEDNIFSGYYPYQNGGIGLVVNESGSDPNIVYRNNFNGMNIGILAQGCNRGPLEGLQLKCNDYTDCEMDKVITWEGESPDYVGIAPSQGSSSPEPAPEDMAGNLFDIHSQTPNNDFDDINNEANSITYYYPQFYDDYRVRPVDFTQNTVNIEEVGEVDWTYENGCPPDEAGGGGSSSEEELRGNIVQSNLTIDSIENLLALLIDGGNTQATQTDVETSLPPETMQVYNDLMNKSPYLSDTVVSTAIEKEDVLPGAIIRDIMVANPNTAKSEALMNKLDERWDPLPEYMKAQILAGRSIVSVREETESTLAARKLERAKYFNALVRLYLEDTLNRQASIDSLKALLQQEPNLNAKYRLAMLSMKQGLWSEGLGVLNSIPAQFELTASEANEHLQFTALYNLLSNIAQQGKTVIEADSAEIASLMGIEASGGGHASVYARNILLALDQMEYEEPVLLPDLLKSSNAQYEYNTLIRKAGEVPGYIRVKPNPAKDYIIVEYELEQETGASIDITDIKGNLKIRLNTTNRQDEVTVNAQDWKPGMYIATLKISSKPVESVKFTITD